MGAAKHVLLGVSGSIAAVKSPELVRLLVDAGIEVNCLLTKSAEQFVSPLALSTFSNEPAIGEMFGPDAYQMPHIRLAEKTNLLVIAPATASMLARCAQGLADDVVSLAFITTTAPVLIAPAMHPTMWRNPATQANVKLLRERGVHFIGPSEGALADATSGEGRMMEPVDIVTRIKTELKIK